MPTRGQKGKVSKKTTVPNPRVLLAETQSGVAGVPAVAQPVPVHHDLVAVLVEIRDKQVAAAVPHDRTPQEDRLATEELAEDRDALGLDGEPVLQVEARRESVVLLQVRVDGVALHRPTLLLVVEPLLNPCLQVVFSGTRALQLGVLQLLEPVGVGRLDGPVHADEEVKHGFGWGLGLRLWNEGQLVSQELGGSLKPSQFVEDGFHRPEVQRGVFHRRVHCVLLRPLVGIVSPPIKRRAV